MPDKGIISKEILIDICDAVREKTGTTDLIPAVDIADKIRELSIGGDDMLQKKVDATGSAYYLFSHMPNTNLDDFASLDTSNVTDMSYMFDYCQQLTTIPAYDTTNVTKMQYAFNSCKSLVSVPALNTVKVTDMYNLFRNCSALTSPPEMDTSNVETMNYMFYGCASLTTIPLYNTSNVINMSYMFNGCTNLTTFPALDTSNVTTMEYMFYKCNNLNNLPTLNTDSVTKMQYMFYQCYDLETIDISYYNISSTSYSSYWCYFCKSLTKIIIRDFGSYVLNSNAFSGCSHLAGIVDEEYNPTGAIDCYIYVPDDMVNTIKNASGWSTYADQIKPLSQLTE